MDIRQKTAPFEFDGKVFQLTCNMNVLSEVQETYDGAISKALDGKGTLRAVNAFLTAMLNDYADSQGWMERYDAKAVGRMLDTTPGAMTARNTLVMGLVTAAFTPVEHANEESEKN